jgi:hypothetical protein
MSRIVKLGLPKLAAFVLAAGVGSTVRAADSVTIVPGSFVQGTVKSSLQAAGYTNTSLNLAAWPLTTGGNFAINFVNSQFQANTLIAFGDGGSIELQLNTPFTPIPGEKDLGIFTAQEINAGSGAFLNADMDAAILVSQDGQNWFTLTGTLVTNPTTYTGITYPLNAPTMSYDYTTDSNASQAGEGKLTATQLAALSVADFTTPMSDDTLFNNPSSTNAQRLALVTDTSAPDYTEQFGTSGGGNWFDVSGSGLSSIDYVMLNGDANDPSTGGVRLEDLFVNANAVPEPGSLSLLCIGAIALLSRSRRR